MGTRLNFSTAYHPQIDGQTERVNQVLEDMLRACVISFGKGWEKLSPPRRVLLQQQLSSESANGSL